MGWKRSVWAQGALLGMACAIAACSGSDDGSDGGSDADRAAATAAAKQHFWDAFGNGDIAAIPAARQDLVAALDAQPDDDETARLAGRSFGLYSSESPRGTVSFSDLPASMENEGKYLQHAIDVSKDPYSRALNRANYSGVPYALGSLQHDPAKIKEAKDIMFDVAREFPALGLFALGPKLMRAAPGSEDFSLAIEDMFRGYELCSGQKIDRVHPDAKAMLSGPYAERACKNLPSTPHNVQGTAFMFADMLVKNGQVDAARDLYAAIPSTEGYGTWSFKDRVPARLASDLHALQASFAATDPATAQVPGVSPCLGCHRR